MSIPLLSLITGLFASTNLFIRFAFSLLFSEFAKADLAENIPGIANTPDAKPAFVMKFLLFVILLNFIMNNQSQFVCLLSYSLSTIRRHGLANHKARTITA